MLRPAIEDRGYRLVLIKMQGEILQIMAENPETKRLGVDECAEISREISALLDVEDPISGQYRLEVSSPGIDRPLTDMQDFVDFCGFEAKVEIDPPHEGQKRFRGVLLKAENDTVEIRTDHEDVAISYGAIQKAKLVLTDELIKATKKQQAV